jgi:predicted TIM-barrel fold metal-dependent hydrolase
MDVLGVAHTAADFVVPRGACDCHVHVFGPYNRFPLAANRLYTPPPALVEDLRALQATLQLDRVVIVQASPQGTDNACVLDAIARLGRRARGVAVVADDVSDAELAAMHQGGIRGIRLNLETQGAHNPQAAGRQLKAAAARVAPHGWHVQMYASATLLASIADIIAALPCPLVADHFGRVRPGAGLSDPEFQALAALVRTGRLYVKLSAPHRISDAPGYADIQPIAAALAGANPDRMLWGSDWPHPNVPPREQLDLAKFDPYRKEDDGANLNRLASWIGDAAVLRKILVDNPARLYGF